MSDYSLKLHAPAAGPDGIERAEGHGTRWLWLDDAARLMNVNEGTLRRRAAKEWHAKCLARQERRPNGQLAWQVSELADPRLTMSRAPVDADDGFAEILARLTDTQRAEFNRDKRILDGWEEALRAGRTIGLDENDVTPRYIARCEKEGLTTSRRTLYRLRADVAKAGGPIGLLDHRWTVTPVDASAVDDKFSEALKRLWLTQQRRSKRTAADMAAAEAGIEFNDAVYKAAQRILNAIPKETVVLYREGSKAFTNQIEPHIDRDWSQIAANEMWCADHHRLDVFVTYIDPRTGEEVAGRPWLHAWQDLRSRKIVGYKLFVGHDPNANVIVSVLTGSIAACYRPRSVLLDNGKDFDGRVVTGLTKSQRRRLGRQSERPVLPDGERMAIGGVLSLLDVEVKHAWPYHGQSKPIERWFRTLSEQFSKLWDGYCGRNHDTKPEWIDARRREKRLPAFADVATALEDYIRGYNASPSMAADNQGRSPDQVWAETLRSRDSVLPELLDFARLTRVPARVRQKAHVVLPGLDVSYGRGEQELINRIGQDVVVAYDPEHLHTAWLCDPKDGRAICRIAARRDLHPNATEQDLREGVAMKKQVKRRARDYMESRPRSALDAVELARLAASKRINRDQEKRLATGTDNDTLLAGKPMAISSVPANLAQLAPRDHAKAFFNHSIDSGSNVIRPAQQTGTDADAGDAPSLMPLTNYRRRREEDADE